MGIQKLLVVLDGGSKKIKKSKIIERKTNGRLVPEHPDIYYQMLQEIKPDEFVEAVYSSVKQSKSLDQLGYLFSGIYPHLLYWHKELWGPVLYHRQIRQWKIPVLATTESIDEFMKDLFSLTKGIEFKKRFTSLDIMREYITFLDHYSFENFGEPIPPPKKKYGERT